MLRSLFLQCLLGVAHGINLSGRKPLGKRSSAATSSESDDGVLEVVQAYVPPRANLDDPACRLTLVDHSFANSYGAPYVGTYAPPTGCEFTTAVLNLSVSAQGQQYDRLALLWLGDVEVWRTSTAMPIASGIRWSYQKDVSAFHALLLEEQKVILDLSNVIEDPLYTAAFNVTIEALFFNDEYAAAPAGFSPAEQIYAISTLSSAENVSSVFTLPDQSGAVNVTLPRNVRSAVVSVLASGNSAEEFWFTNVPSEYVNTFPDNAGWLVGYSPFREVQVLLDGQLAGVVWPFPNLFTGGVDPGAWRPIVGIDAYDLRSFEVDVTPWLSLLCDGEQHTIELQVVGYDTFADDNIGAVGEDWYVSGSLFVWLDDRVNQTVAGEITVSTPAPTFDFQPTVGSVMSCHGVVTNTSFYFSLAAERTLSISSTIQTADGEVKNVTWEQSISFLNIQNMTDQAFNQSLSMVTKGSYSGSATNGTVSRYEYPINLYSAYNVSAENAVTTPGSVFCMADRSLLMTERIALLPFLSGISAGPESLATRQNVTSMYYWNDTIVGGIESEDTNSGQAWLSYTGTPGLAAGVGVFEYGEYLEELNDAWVESTAGWYTIDVPPTVALPIVEGEPAV
ncbi:peptide N-acetyl-beta-D-glucosaminyl asparaginase amidase A-domain-containing protein [Xylariales sp. PMI_506]|nr:peptide N-acetyl-beta-D-glucosaminyl asparaginase amidase A-domain-containing protein [Xylariales sp. PMI_506]